MKIKSVLILIGLSFVIGILVCLLFIQKRGQSADLQILATHIKRTLDRITDVELLLLDLQYPPVETLLIPTPEPGKVDTIYIDSTTPIGEIPVRKETYRESLPVKVGKDQYALPIDISLVFRGILYEYGLDTPGLTIPFKIPSRSWFNPYLSLNLWIDRNLRFYPEAEAGLLLFNRFGIAGRIEANQLDSLKAKIGGKFIF